MPPRKPKASNGLSDERREGLRKSPRKRNIPNYVMEDSNSGSENTPKKPRRQSSTLGRKRKSPSLDFSDCTPSTSFQKKEEKVCAFYRVKTGEDGRPIFSKALLKYFMTCDSPEMDDLKNKRFNTSFLKNKKTSKDDLKIFTEEEDNDPKWLENVPKLNFDMPEVPGTGHTKIFASMPINGVDSDEELKKLTKRRPGRGRRRSPRCTAFKGKPLPDHSLTVDYSALFESESSHQDVEDNIDDDDDESNMTQKRINKAISEAVRENKKSILLSLLSAPSDGPIRPYKYGNSFVPHFQNLSNRKEDEMLLKKYKDVLGNRQVHVVLTRLPIDDQLLELYNAKKLNLKSATGSHGKKKVSEVKEKKVKVSRLGLPKLPKKKRGNTKS